MAVTYNMKGTSHPNFAIGKNGPKIFNSATDPSGSETVANSDLWIDTTNNQLKIRVSGSWIQVGETISTLSSSTLGVSGDTTFTGDVTVSGDFTVTGTTTSINSTVLDVHDNKVTLNTDWTAAPTQDAGIVVNRGTSTDVELRWNETSDAWEFTDDGTNYYEITGNTATQTLTNKTLTAPVLNAPVFGTGTNSPYFTEVRFNNSNIMKFNQMYTGAASGSYFSANEYQKVVTITPDGDAQNYQVIGRITAQNASETHTVYFNAALRSNTLPDLSWTIDYSEEYNGNRYIDPQLWTKETTTAGFIFAFKTLGTIYGTVTVDFDVIPRSSSQLANVTVNSTQNSEQASVDTGFTERDMTRVFRRQGTVHTLSGNLLPDTTETYDIGSSTLRFNDIYLAGSTVDIGGTKISKDTDGNIDLLDANNNRKIIKASAIELYDTNGKKIKIERDSSSGKMKSRKFDSSGNEETDSDDVLELVEDKSPKLGGDLDLNTNKINGTGDINITGTITSSSNASIGGTLNNHIIPSGSGTLALTSDISLQTAEEVWGDIASAADGTVDLGSIDGATSIWSDLDIQQNLELSVEQNSASGSGAISYNPLTAVLTYTPPSIPTDYITASSTDTLTNKSGNISQWTNDAGYLTSETDSQTLSFSSPNLTISNGNTVDLSALTPTSLDFSAITNTPTTLSGYGITDGITADSTTTLTNKTLTTPDVNTSLKMVGGAQLQFRDSGSYITENGGILLWNSAAGRGVRMYSNGNERVAVSYDGNLELKTGVDIVFEGATADDYETTLTVTDPTADRTVTIPDESGTVSLDAGWKKLGSANWTSDTGYADFSVVDPTKYRQYKVVWWISHQNSTNSGNQWFITSAVFLTSSGEVTQYDNNVTWRSSGNTSETVNSSYAGDQTQMWLAGNGTTYDSHGEALFTVPNSSSFRAAMRGNSQLIGAPRQSTTGVNYLEEMASVAYNQDPTAITGIRIRGWNGTGYTSQAGNITIFGMEM